MFLLLILDYCTVLSSIITVKLQKQLGIPECPRTVSRPAPVYKKFVSRQLCYVFLLSHFFYNSFPSYDELLIMFTKHRASPV